MDNRNNIDRILAGDLPPLSTITQKELSSLTTLLQAFHAGLAIGRTNKSPEAEYDLISRLKVIGEALSDSSGRGYVKSTLFASWPKAKEAPKPLHLVPLNNLSITPPTDPESTPT